jgi:hypothetical protein
MVEETLNRDLEIRIKAAISGVNEDFDYAFGAVKELKGKMNELERLTVEKSGNKNVTALNAAIERLNELTDSQILKSKEAWRKYEALKHECEAQDVAPPQFEEMYEECKKVEQLATDLTCYSLGHPKVQ